MKRAAGTASTYVYVASFDDRRGKKRLLTMKTPRLREVKKIVECHTAYRVRSGVPRPPHSVPPLHDSAEGNSLQLDWIGRPGGKRVCPPLSRASVPI